MTTVAESTNAAARRALEILDDAFAYFEDAPSRDRKAAPAETEGYVAYADAA